MKVLLVEDERRLADALAELLMMEKYEVDMVYDGASALTAIETGSYDVIVLDVMLPEVNGFEVVRRVRNRSITTPILMLTARDDVMDKVMGLDCGADDYMTKPFDTTELLARLRALTRRASGVKDGIYNYGDIILNTNTVTLTNKDNNKSVRLTEKEYRILEFLMANQGQIVSREQLAIRIWGYDYDSKYNTVEVYLSFTRRKLSDIDSKVQIKALRGIGYELRLAD